MSAFTLYDIFIVTQLLFFFFFNDTATTEIYTLSLHDALPISTMSSLSVSDEHATQAAPAKARVIQPAWVRVLHWINARSEEHTSELQSRQYLVCRLLLEKKKTTAIKRPGSQFVFSTSRLF